MDEHHVRDDTSNYPEKRDSNSDERRLRPFASANRDVRTLPTNMLLTMMVTVVLCLGAMVPLSSAQPTIAGSTVRGVLLTIRGDRYVIRQISGVLRYLRVDKNTQRPRLIVPGEQIEAQVSSDGHAVSIKPVH